MQYLVVAYPRLDEADERWIQGVKHGRNSLPTKPASSSRGVGVDAGDLPDWAEVLVNVPSSISLSETPATGGQLLPGALV